MIDTYRRCKINFPSLMRVLPWLFEEHLFIINL